MDDLIAKFASDAMAVKNRKSYMAVERQTQTSFLLNYAAFLSDPNLLLFELHCLFCQQKRSS